MESTAIAVCGKFYHDQMDIIEIMLQKIYQGVWIFRWRYFVRQISDSSRYAYFWSDA